MITPDGTVKIMDFGIARVESMAGLTQAGDFIGTPRYISPEVALGRGADARSDIYAVGLLAYEMLAGEPPFEAENHLALLRKHVEVPPSPLRRVRKDVPAWLEAVVMRAIAKDPAQRFQTPAEMLAALATATPPSPRVSADEPEAGKGRRRRKRARAAILLLIGAVAAVALAVAALLVFGVGWGNDPSVVATEVGAGQTLVPEQTLGIVTMVVTNTPAQIVVATPTATLPPAPTHTATLPLAPTTPPTLPATATPTRQPTQPAMETPTVTPTDTPQPTDTATVKPTAQSQATAQPANTPAAPVSGRIAYSAQGYLHVADAATGRDLFAPIADMRQPDFRADGVLLLAKGFQGAKTSLWTINANTGSFVREQSSFTNDYRPSWSPDGTRFVYDSLHQGGGVSNLYINAVDSNIDEALSFSGQPIIGTSPVWMENDWIAFTGCDYWPGGGGGANCGIFRMPSWGAQPALVYPDNLTVRATDSQDANLLLMSQRDGNWEVYSLPTGGGAARNLSNDQGSSDGLGAFSPDGKRVAFASNRGGGWAVWMVIFDGSGLRKLFDLPGPPTGDWTEEHIAWGP
jgi:serine/threonine-protein kinase